MQFGKRRLIKDMTRTEESIIGWSGTLLIMIKEKIMMNGLLKIIMFR